VTNETPGTIGRYQIRRELGRGMMGVVYLAKDPDLGRDIALKVIQLPPGASADDRAGFEQRFFAEAQSAARLTHPGIVIVHDVGRDAASGALFMALQLLPGRTLDSVLKEQGRIEWPDALRIGRRVAEALQHAHFEGVVHRDIKPANIMILPSGEPKIMDFGIAKIEASRLTATGQFIGTPLYMSPEQAMARPVDGRSDIFSLGSVLYEMLTGTPAFGGESVTKILYQLMSADPEPPSALVPSIPLAVDNIMRRSLAKDLELRYRDAQALANDIAAIPGVSVFTTSPTNTGPSGTAAAAPSVDSGPTPLQAEWWTHETRAISAARPKGPRGQALAVGIVLLALALAGSVVAYFFAPTPVARRITEEIAQPTPAPAAPIETATPARATPTAAPSNPNQPPQLVVEFEHSLKEGTLRIFVDDLLVVDQPFGGKITRKVVGLEMRKGHLTETLEIAPGLRNIKVEVSWEKNVKTERSQTFFNPGRRLRLKAKLGGLRKNLSLEWN
jgi:serine/threonine-protein kinase